ncbi:hypothetical protein M3Y99_00659300 [Aphelenchoides fujianensis]|nr:hypothetical protein M3Y99_00659300 [Aphelenchoides fujianensis]
MLAADQESSAASPKSGLRNITANFHDVQATAAEQPAERRANKTMPLEDLERTAEIFEPAGGSERPAAVSAPEAPPFQEIANVPPTERPSGRGPSVRLMRPLDKNKSLEEILATSIKRANRPRQSPNQQQTSDEMPASPAASPPALLASTIVAHPSPAAAPPTLVVQVAEPEAAHQPPPTPQPTDQPPALSPALPIAAVADETEEREEETRMVVDEPPTAPTLPIAVEVAKPAASVRKTSAAPPATPSTAPRTAPPAAPAVQPAATRGSLVIRLCAQLMKKSPEILYYDWEQFGNECDPMPINGWIFHSECKLLFLRLANPQAFERADFALARFFLFTFQLEGGDHVVCFGKKSGRELAQQFKARMPQPAGFTGVADVVFQLVGTLEAADSALFLARESNCREIRSWACESFVVL